MDGSFYISPEIILLTIVVLIVCYLLSKIWQAQLEPNIKIKGKSPIFFNYQKYQFVFPDSSSTHHWEYTDMVLHLPLHCNICHTFLLTSKGKKSHWGKKQLFYPEITKNLMFEKCGFCEMGGFENVNFLQK